MNEVFIVKSASHPVATGLAILATDELDGHGAIIIAITEAGAKKYTQNTSVMSILTLTYTGHFLYCAITVIKEIVR